MTSPLRILVVLPMSGGSLPIGRYCVQALRDLGHTVKVFEAPAFQDTFTALKGLGVTSDRLEQIEGSFLQVVSQAILAQAETFEPHIMLALAQAPIGRHVLRKLSQMGVVTAMWFVEDHKIFTYWRAFAPLYDFFAIIQKSPFIEELAKVGQSNSIYLPMAALPSMHKPLTLSDADRAYYGADISFLGAGYPNRRVAFRALAKKNFKIWGTEWDDEDSLKGVIQAQGARISPEDCVKIYNATRININLHSSVQCRELVPEGDFVNPRTFELAAIGAFQLVDSRTLMPELFPEGTLATFTTHEQMLEKIDYFLAHPDTRAEYAAKAREHVLAQHTYQHRMQTLLDVITARRPELVAQKQDKQLPACLPESLRPQLQCLLQELELPADTPFSDVIARIRQRQGQLSSLETTLLFLDEWQKQYTKTSST